MSNVPIRTRPTTDYKEVRCPVCDKKLFDVAIEASATVSVKCPRCKAHSVIDISAIADTHKPE